MFIHIFVVVEHMINEDVKHNSMEHEYNLMEFLIIMDDLLNLFDLVDVKLLFNQLVELE